MMFLPKENNGSCVLLQRYGINPSEHPIYLVDGAPGIPRANRAKSAEIVYSKSTISNRIASSLCYLVVLDPLQDMVPHHFRLYMVYL